MRNAIVGFIEACVFLALAAIGVMLGLGVVHAHVLPTVRAAGYGDSIDLTACISVTAMFLTAWLER